MIYDLLLDAGAESDNHDPMKLYLPEYIVEDILALALNNSKSRTGLVMRP